MALISIRNVVAPFENKTHLFTIVVIAVIFGVWRASGGSVTSQPLPSSANGIQSRANEEVRFQPQKVFSNPPLENQSSSHPASKAQTSQTGASTSRDKLDSLLAPREQTTVPTATQKHHSALDDIEKSLGMR